MKANRWIRGGLLAATFLCISAAPAIHAQCAPDAPYRQSAAVGSRYPDPPVRFDTPAFAPGKTGFTTQDEMMRFLKALEEGTDNLYVRTAGHSQEGRILPALVFSASGRYAAAELRRSGKPIVFIVGQVHGNEPAGGEAMLAFARALAQGELKPLLERVSVVIVPRANPDGAHYFWQGTARLRRRESRPSQGRSSGNHGLTPVDERAPAGGRGRYTRIQRGHALDREVRRRAVVRLHDGVRNTSQRTGGNLLVAALEPESASGFVSLGIVPVDKRGLSNPQEAAPSEVPIFRLMRPAPLDTQSFP